MLYVQFLVTQNSTQHFSSTFEVFAIHLQDEVFVFASMFGKVKILAIAIKELFIDNF